MSLPCERLGHSGMAERTPTCPFAGSTPPVLAPSRKLLAQPIAVGFHFDRQLSERHRPSCGARGTRGDARMRHHHFRATADFLEVDPDLSHLGCPSGMPMSAGDITLPFGSDMYSL